MTSKEDLRSFQYHCDRQMFKEATQEKFILTQQNEVEKVRTRRGNSAILSLCFNCYTHHEGNKESSKNTFKQAREEVYEKGPLVTLDTRNERVSEENHVSPPVEKVCSQPQKHGEKGWNTWETMKNLGDRNCR